MLLLSLFALSHRHQLISLSLSLSHRLLRPKQVCRNGKCTAELENIIPDYTHVTQVVSRAQPVADRLLSRSDSLYTAAPPHSSNSNGLPLKPRNAPQSQRFRISNQRHLG